jgi:hypothetical protein
MADIVQVPRPSRWDSASHINGRASRSTRVAPPTPVYSSLDGVYSSLDGAERP